MHIVLGLLSAFGVVLVALWRINMAANAVKDLSETASDTRKWLRRRRWQKKSRFNALLDVHDPREAAAAMMVAVAEYDGAMTARERAIIIAAMKVHFHADHATAEALLSRGRWLAQNATDLSFFLKQLARPIEQVCSQAEKDELIAMLTSTAAADAKMDTVPEHAIVDLKRRLAA